MSVSPCFDYYSFVIYFEVSQCDVSRFVLSLILKIALDIWISCGLYTLYFFPVKKKLLTVIEIYPACYWTILAVASLTYHIVTPGPRSLGFSIFVLLPQLLPCCLLLSLEGISYSKVGRKLSTREASAGQRRSPSCLSINLAQTHAFEICQVSLNPVQHLCSFHNERTCGIRIT